MVEGLLVLLVVGDSRVDLLNPLLNIEPINITIAIILFSPKFSAYIRKLWQCCNLDKLVKKKNERKKEFVCEFLAKRFV